VFFITGNV